MKETPRENNSIIILCRLKDMITMKKKLIPIIIELIGVSTVGAGIGLELALGGEIYFVMITTGSLLVALGGIIWGKFMRGGK